MSYMRSGKFRYLTNNFNLNRALDNLDAEVTELSRTIEELSIMIEKAPSTYDFDKLKERIERIEKFLEKFGYKSN